MALYEIGNDGSINRIAGNVASIIDSSAGMPLGLIFASAIPITDARVHLLDGTTIAQNGVYKTFVDLIKSLVSSGYNISCSQTEFDADVATTGNCGKFVIDNNAGTIRLPKITTFIQGLSSITNIGDSLSAGLPNITGSFGSTDAAGNSYLSFNKNYTTKAFSGSNTGVSMRFSTDLSTGASGGWVDKISFNANNGASTKGIYGNSDTVQPKATQYPYYIVLATGYKSVQSLNVDAIMTELNKKSDAIQYLSESDKKKWFLLTHPINSYYITDETENPIDKYGGGWSKVEGRFLIGAGSNGDGATYTFSHTGGSKDAIVVSHDHANVYIKVRTNKAGIGNDYGTSGNHIVTNTGANGYGRVDMAYTNTVGSSGTDKNMPPYRVVYIWKRIS